MYHTRDDANLSTESPPVLEMDAYEPMRQALQLHLIHAGLRFVVHGGIISLMHQTLELPALVSHGKCFRRDAVILVHA